MHPIQQRSAAAFAVAALLGLPLMAQAVSLNVPVSPASYADTALPGTTEAARPELAGTALEDVLTPFSFNGITGTVQNRVVKEDLTGTLDFYWKVNVDATPIGSANLAPNAATNTPFDITAFRLGNFGVANITDADWRVDGLGDTPPRVARLFNSTGRPDGAVNFLFTDPPLVAGKSSMFFFLHTNATNYAKTAVYDLLGNGNSADAISGSFATFAPSAVPEPGSMALVCAGLAMTAAVSRRQRRH